MLLLEKRAAAHYIARMAQLQPVAYDSKIEGNVIFTTMDAAMK